jgi:hypothetical protein
MKNIRRTSMAATALLGLCLINAAQAQLFVANSGGQYGDNIGEYTTAGATINGSLVTGLSNPNGVAVSGGDIFVANTYPGEISEYTTTGAPVNTSLITGLDYPWGVAVETVPEPSTYALLAGGLGGWLLWRLRTRRTLV